MQTTEEVIDEQKKITIKECLEIDSWDALKNKIDIKFCDQYMFMACVVQNATHIYLYKHSMTRRYLNLDKTGNVYRYCSGDSLDDNGYYERLDGAACRTVLEQHLRDGLTKWL